MQVGEGTYTFSDGTTVNAVFKDSRPNGFGIAKFGDGRHSLAFIRTDNPSLPDDPQTQTNRTWILDHS